MGGEQIGRVRVTISPPARPSRVTQLGRAGWARPGADSLISHAISAPTSLSHLVGTPQLSLLLWLALQSEPRVREKGGRLLLRPNIHRILTALLSDQPGSVPEPARPGQAACPWRPPRPRARLLGSQVPPHFVASWVPTLWALIPSSAKWVHRNLYLPVPGAGVWDSAVSLVLSQPRKARSRRRTASSEGERREGCVPCGSQQEARLCRVGESSAEGKAEVGPGETA